jgi:hypothetical protein
MCTPSYGQADFDTSLHFTRAGKNFWYGEANGGFEGFTNVPIEDLGCVECHGPTDANSVPYPPDYVPGCSDCHTADFTVEQAQCYSCHGRQKTEAQALGYSDVHRDAGMVCWDCHSMTDIHGDGNEYDTMFRPGAITADCTNAGCHVEDPEHDALYNPHDGVIHCKSCHTQSVISCYNCHFESQVESHVKRAKQPLHDFVMLVNREEDGKVHTASFQSLSYQGDAFVAFGPYTAHTITRENARTCGECHNNFSGAVAAIEAYNTTGEIRFAEWDDTTKTLSWIHGIIPMPCDYQETFKMDFLTYTGLTTDPPPGDPTLWTGIGKDTWDGSQMFFASPLNRRQMVALGFDIALCDADLDGNCVVDVNDLLIVLGEWGNPGGDITGDGTTDVDDLLALLAAWGDCP